MTTPLTWAQVRAWRLDRHRLRQPVAASEMPTMVGGLGGIQAQILPAAELALGVRVAGMTRVGVRDALWRDKSLVKTYGLRGTLHLLPAAEVGVFCAAMQALPFLTDQALYRDFGLTEKNAEALFAAIGDALRAGPLTRDELAVEVGRRTGAALSERLTSTWGELLKPAAYRGVLCFGPSRGAKVTFVHPGTWLSGVTTPDPQKSLVELVRRYFAGYGPATYRDLARWFGTSPARARELQDLVAGELCEVLVEGHTAWLLSKDVTGPWPAPSTRSGGGTVRLVGQYELYVLGCGPKEQITPPEVRPRIFAVGRGRYEGPVALNLLLIDGLVRGIWQRRERGRDTTVVLECFADLTRPQRRALDAEIDRLGHFLGGPVSVQYGPVDQ